MKSPAVRAMARLGMLRITLVMTVVSALMSVATAWLLSHVMVVGDLNTHLRLAFLIPFFVTPGFSYLTALSLRDSRLARKAAFEMARRDPLTGVANRRAFFDADGVARGRDGSEKGRAILFLDIDHFKAINDTYGHEGGDAVLVHLGKLLTASVRSSDLVARFGGEEFVIATVDADQDAVEALATRILAAIRNAVVPFRTQDIRYTVSIGAALGPSQAPTERLLSEADAQLYLAKHAGRDTLRISQGGGRPAAGPTPVVPGRGASAMA